MIGASQGVAVPSSHSHTPTNECLLASLGNEWRYDLMASELVGLEEAASKLLSQFLGLSFVVDRRD